MKEKELKRGRRLELNKLTLRNLTPAEQAQVVGGMITTTIVITIPITLDLSVSWCGGE